MNSWQVLKKEIIQFNVPLLTPEAVLKQLQAAVQTVPALAILAIGLVGHSLLTHWLPPHAMFVMPGPKGQTVCCWLIGTVAAWVFLVYLKVSELEVRGRHG